MADHSPKPIDPAPIELRPSGVVTSTDVTYTDVVDRPDTDAFEALPGGGTSQGRPFSPASFLRVKWGIVAIFVLVSAATIPLIWLFIVPVYQTKAVIRVSPVVSRIAFNIEENGMLPLYSSYLNTQVSIIRSPSVLRRVLDRKDVGTTKWYHEEARSLMGTPLSRLERLMEALSVKPQQRTELIDVSVTTKNAKDSEVLSNAIVDEYKRYSDESYREQDIRRYEALTNEQTALHRQIEGLVATKLSLTEALGTTDTRQLRSQLTHHLAALETQRDALKRKLAMTDWELESLPTDEMKNSTQQEEALTEENAVTNNMSSGQQSEDEPGDESPQYSKDLEWRQRNLDLKASRHKLEAARRQYGDAHPRIVALQSDVDYAEQLLKAREAQLDEEWENASAETKLAVIKPAVLKIDLPEEPQGATLERESEKTARQIELLDDGIQRQREKVLEAGKIAKDIAGYDEQLKQKREYYEVLHSRMTQLDMESKAPARISIASYAIAPTRPFRDRRVLLTALALGGALALGIAVGYLRIVMDTRIHEAGEVAYTVRVPFLGQLPSLKGATDLMRECTDPNVMERVRMVRTALLERLNGGGHQVVLITSSSSRTGKTTVSFLLARSLAQLGKRTLLVEADLRRPSLFSHLRIGSSAGLTALLSGTADDRTAVVSTGIAKLDLITAGQRSGNFDPERLANGLFQACLNRWRQVYDFILLDSPPVLPVADARILAGHADGTIMVLRAAHCRRAAVMQAYADLSASGGTLLGTVLVGAEGSESYQDYSDYEAYYNDPPALEAPAHHEQPPEHRESSNA